ncbi:hypothetical protein VOLCADRAFT_95765 [Volvox carteri f. nagariensis]|uniref:Uncharacterized protein n=1 Tax=Volvox carteri f. nagariensis TaxID=3068 RepID=D8U8B8_VOLCA|nr:uncharacterized protein VOLCADRAFT_95765 [Volvox carteri f. nagariensis]EFJ44064.1 hypothetical protein VOLCADRAFT_95765 [Volvox carteri f. nagariensis]|eukprot:XP_002954865.1 hypothetical protein VOLCADRAFT_95765 [Volvox carteri f. nagariensis]
MHSIGSKPRRPYTADASSYDDAPTRDCNPPGRPDPCGIEQQQSPGVWPVKAEGAELEVPNGRARSTVARRPLLDLDVCPSFSEQQPERTKPLFLDRHNTLQLVHESQRIGAYSSNSATTISSDTPSSSSSGSTGTSNGGSPEAAAASTAPACSPVSIGAAPVASYLPSWNIARSELWMLAQRALLSSLNMQPPGAPEKNIPATDPTAAAPAATAFGATSGTATKTPFACISTQATVTQQAPGLRSLFRSITSRQRRACPATPRGMGPLPAGPLMPAFTLASLTAAQPSATTAKSRSGPWASADAAECTDGATEVEEAPLSLEVDWENVLSIIMNTATMAAAEAVLGHDAPAALRRRLRERLRCTLAGASVMWFLLNLHTTSDMLAHLDFEHDFVTSSKVSGCILLAPLSCDELRKEGGSVSVCAYARARPLHQLWGLRMKHTKREQPRARNARVS